MNAAISTDATLPTSAENNHPPNSNSPDPKKERISHSLLIANL